MSNDDCSAKCPKCGKSTKIRISKRFPELNRIKEFTIYCPSSSCEWQENWKKNEENNYFKKQPEPPKTTTKIFKIEYTNKDPSIDFKLDKLDGETVHKILMENTSPRIGIKIETFDPSVWETTKIPEKIIKERCNTCLHYDYCSIKESKRCIKNYFIAWRSMAMEKTEDHGNDELQASGDYEAMMDIAKQAIKNSKDPEMFKDIELKLDFTKSCENCGWQNKKYNHQPMCECPKDCYTYSEWKPIEKDSDNEITAKKRPFFSETRDPEKRE